MRPHHASGMHLMPVICCEAAIAAHMHSTGEVASAQGCALQELAEA